MQMYCHCCSFWCGRVVVRILVKLHRNSGHQHAPTNLTSKPTQRHGQEPLLVGRFSTSSNTTMPMLKLTLRSTHRHGPKPLSRSLMRRTKTAVLIHKTNKKTKTNPGTKTMLTRTSPSNLTPTFLYFHRVSK